MSFFLEGYCWELVSRSKPIGAQTVRPNVVFLWSVSSSTYSLRPTDPKILYNTALSSFFSVLALGHIQEYAPSVLDLDALRLPHSTAILHQLSNGTLD